MPRPKSRKNKTKTCTVVFDDDGSVCGQSPAEGNPPTCDECFEALEAEGITMERAEELADRAVGMFDRLTSSVSRLLGAVRGPQQQPPQAGPPPPRQRRQTGAPPPPRPGPPPPRPGAPRPPDRPGAMGLSQALYEFGWGPGKTSFTAKEVKDRRKALAPLFHGDPNGGFDGRMKAINEACSVLLKHAKPAA